MTTLTSHIASHRLSVLARATALTIVLATTTVAAPSLAPIANHTAATAGSGTTTTQTSTTIPADFRGFVLWAADDIDAYWESVYGAGGTFVRPEVTFFVDPIATPCDANATPEEGPFYCQNVVYVPEAWFAADAARTNDFAIAYVMAHEIGHDVQDTQGILASLNNGIITSVQTELQADCLAGVWAASANRRGMLSTGDYEEATQLATTIGDDYLGFQPADYTHGTSAQRVAWFNYGFQMADGTTCRTY
ncbi:MAG: neutral zinc metallopeptidase [Candidatus Limnocylindrales bacterium]